MLNSLTVADIFRPKIKSYALLYDIELITIGSALLALSAQIKIGGPVPFTLQTLAVLLIGALFGPYKGSLTVIAYLLEGAAGLPVFSGGSSGISVFAGMKGGYLVGFVPAAFITGLLAQRGWDRKISTTILAMIAGDVVILAFGFIWLLILMGVTGALTTGLYPFIAGDLIKIAIAAALLPGGWKVLGHFGLAGK
jgi:biotin transporter BioY